ncbi:YopX family protein [Cryobacterium sp. GrIS_2_6]|uniref:YopX family protein n=1 Tax=Cryobacterium sp. GrIS_2_6 TaxID=3162785 RepID=UPI002DFEF894|nr:hypothetical protein [Cryobacterium psychrotolerans]
MNREIKFRAWDGETMRLLDQMYVGVGQIGFSYTHYVDLGDMDHERTELMQYTGLKDKNGMEIYEGDILENRLGEQFPVTFTLGAFRTNKNMTLGDFDCEVIGNIYESPELLEAASPNVVNNHV